MDSAEDLGVNVSTAWYAVQRGEVIACGNKYQLVEKDS